MTPEQHVQAAEAALKYNPNGVQYSARDALHALAHMELAKWKRREADERFSGEMSHMETAAKLRARDVVRGVGADVPSHLTDVRAPEHSERGWQPK